MADINGTVSEDIATDMDHDGRIDTVDKVRDHPQTRLTPLRSYHGL
jgi:hypothetical protein